MIWWTFIVPIYNERVSITLKRYRTSSSEQNVTPDFTFTSCDIRCIPKAYSAYNRGNEVPSGLLALVGCTMGCYEKDGELAAALNLNWVVVIATDDWMYCPFMYYNVKWMK